MDFHGLKRKELQSLCKKHRIPANLKNTEMADRLSALFKEEKQTKRGRSCMKDLSVVNEEEVVGSKEAKRVKFSPQNETFVFEKTDPREVRLLARGRRGFRKQEMEENPGCRIEGIEQNDDVLKKVKEKVVGKNLRRRSVVVNSECRIDDNAAKGVGRNLRRKSVVGNSEKVIGSEVDDHGEEPVKRVLRRRTVVVKSDANANVVPQSDDDAEKHVGKGLRGRSVGEAYSALGSKIEGGDVEKGGGRTLRRKSVVGKGQTVVGVEIEDEVVKAGGRVSRRKSLVGKGQNGVGAEIEGEVEEASERISRRKSVVGKVAAVSEAVKGVNVDNVERQCTERGDLEQNLRCRGKKIGQVSVQKLLLSPCVEKKAKTSRKDQGVEGEVAVAGDSRPPDKMVTRRQLRSKAVVAEDSGKGDGDNDVGVSERGKLAERQEKNVKTRARVTAAKEHKDKHVFENGQENYPEVVPKNRKAKNGGKKPAMLKKQEVKGGKEVGVEDLGEANDGDNKLSESKGLKRRGLRKSKTNGGPKVIEVMRKSSRQKGMSMFESSSSEQVVDDSKGHQSMNVMDLGDHEMAAQCVNEQEVVGHSTDTPAPVHDKETITGGSALSQSLSDCRECTVDEQCPATEYSVSAEKVANPEVASEISPKNAEKMNNTLPLEHYKEETDSLYKTHESALHAFQTPVIDSSMFKDSGDWVSEAESLMTTDKIQETFSNLNNAVDKNSCEEAALSPPTPSNRKLQLCVTLLSSNAEQNSVGESVCRGTVKPSIPERSGVSDVGRQQPSNSLSDFKDEMRNSETFESSEGLECNDQSRNKQLIQPESWCEESPCLISSYQTNNEVEDNDELINAVAVTVEGSDTNDQSNNEQLLQPPESWCEESPCRSGSPPNDDVEDNSINCTAVIVEESDANDQSRNEQLNQWGSWCEDVEDNSINCTAVIVEESDANDQSRNEQLNQWGSWCEETPCLRSSPLNVNVVEESSVNCAVMIVEESDVNDQSTNEHLTQPERWCEESPCLRSSPPIDIVVEDKSIDCVAVIVEESDVQLNEQDKAVLWDSCGSVIRENAVVGPEASVAANVQSPVNNVGLTVSSHASPAALRNFMEEHSDIDTVASLKKDSSSTEAEDFQRSKSPVNDGTEARTEPSSDINTSSLYRQSEIDGSVNKGKDGEETPDRSCLDQMNVKLEDVKHDISYSNVREELQFEKTDSLKNQDAFGSSIGEGVPVLSQERKCSLVNVRPDVFGSTSHKTFECVSVSDKANYLEQSFWDASEAPKSDISSFKKNIISATSVKFEDRELPEASHSASVLSQSDVGSTCTKFSGSNLSIDTDNAADKLEFHLNDINKSGDWNSMLQKDIHHQLDNHRDRYVAQTCELTVVTGSDADGSHKDTQTADHTCFGNNGNMETVDEGDKYITGMLPEEVNCFNDPEFQQHLVSVNSKDGNSKDNTDAQSKDLDSENIDWTSEYLLALDGEVEESVLFPERKSADLAYDRSTLQFGVHSRTVLDTTMDFECMAVKEDKGVNDLDIKDGEPVETSNSESAQLSGKFESISNEVSENVLNKESIVSETSLKNDETSEDQQSNSYLITAETNGNQTPDIYCVDDSTLFTSQEKANLSFETGNTSTVQEFSVEKEEDSSSCGPYGKPFKMTEISGSQMRNSGNILLTDATTALDIGTRSSVVSCPPMYVKSICYSATSEVVSASQHVLEEYVCSETLQDACMGGVEGAHSGKPISSYGDQYNEVKSGDTVEPDAEISDFFSAESAIPDNLTQASVCEMDDGPKTVTGKNLADDAGATEMELQGLSCSPFSFSNRKIDGAKCSSEAGIAETRDNIYSATVEFCCFGEDKKGVIDVVGASECAPEVQTYNQLNDANEAGEEKVNEEPEEKGSENGNDASASTRFNELLPFDAGEVSEVQVEGVKCISGEQAINQEHEDGNMDPIGQDSCMTDQDHLTLEKPENLESMPRVNHLMDSSPELIDCSKSKSPDGKDDITNFRRALNPLCENNEVMFDSSEEKVVDCSVVDVLPKSMEEHAYIGDVEEVDSGIANLFNDDQDDEGEMVGPGAENSEVCPSESTMPDNIIPQALFHKMDDEAQSIAEKNLTSSTFSAAKENTEADTADLRDNMNSSMAESYSFDEIEMRVGDVKEASESNPRVETENHLYATNRSEQEKVFEEQVGNACSKGYASSTSISDVFLASDLGEAPDVNTNIVLKKSVELDFNVEGNCMFGKQVIKQEHAARNMDLIDKDACLTEEVHSALERFGDLGCSYPGADNLMNSAPEHILPSKSKSPEGEDVERASNLPVCEDDGVIVTLSKSMEGDDEADAEHFFESSVIMIGREGNDSGLRDNRADASASSPYVAENVTGQLQEQSHTPLLPSYRQMEPTEKSACQTGTIIAARFDNAENEGTKSDIVFTDSEIELFWEKTAKDDVQTEAANVTNYVNLMDFTNVDCSVSTHESVVEKIQEPENSALGDQDQLGDVVVDMQNCNDDNKNEIPDKVLEQREDLDANDKVLMSSMIQRRNTRSVLIHGTPKRLPAFKHDMKENTPAPKTLLMADATALKPSFRRRKALDDIGK